MLGAHWQYYSEQNGSDIDKRLKIYLHKRSCSLTFRFAIAPSQLEGTQVTLNGVLVNQVAPNDKDKTLNKVRNYYLAMVIGYDILKKNDFSDEFFKEIAVLQTAKKYMVYIKV